MVVGEISVQPDMLVIGAGPGGYVAALRAAQLGKQVMLVEKEPVLGGICLNHGCIPSKALIHVSEFVDMVKHAKDFGVEVKGLRVYPKEMQAWKQGVIDKLVGGIRLLCEKNGIEVIQGTAFFENSNKALIKSEKGATYVEFRSAVIATGSRPRPLPGAPFDGETIISSTEALQLNKLPKELVIVGGGYIGMEMGGVFARLKTKVHLVESAPQLLSSLDADLVRPVQRALEEHGAVIHLGAKVKKAEKKDGRASVTLETKEGTTTSKVGTSTLECDKVLVAIGRVPNTEELQLNTTKVTTDKQGFIEVNDKMQTKDPNIYAIGDVVGGAMLAHKASREGKVVAEVIAGLPSAFDNRFVPAVIFCDPEIAYVGLTESQAKEEGFTPVVGKFPFAASGRALTLNDSRGFVRVVADKSTDQVLGVHIVGPQASNLIGEAALAIEMGARVEDITATIHVHPTLPESLMEAAEAVHNASVHIYSPKRA